jgi:hypothetical protein
MKNYDEKQIHIAMERVHAYERAMIASRLIDDKFFADTDMAVRKRDKVLFYDTCKDAKIPDELRDHMWKIVDAAWETVYAKMSPNPIW